MEQDQREQEQAQAVEWVLEEADKAGRAVSDSAPEATAFAQVAGKQLLTNAARLAIK